MPTIERGGLATWYETLGSEDAPPVLLLHDAGSDLRVWIPAARRLAGDYWLILADLRGHGLSSRDEGGPDPDIAVYLSDVDAILAELGIELCAVAGLGFGALLALRMAIMAPERVAALVAGGQLEGVLRESPGTGEREEMAAGFGKLGAIAYGRRLAASVRDPYLGAGVAALYHDVQTEGALDALAAMAAARLDVSELAMLRTPAMVVTGEQGSASTAGDRLAELCPGARRVRIRDAGDDVASTHAEAFAEQMVRFFRAVERGSPIGNQAVV